MFHAEEDDILKAKEPSLKLENSVENKLIAKMLQQWNSLIKKQE